jgi:hypothetical protein
MAGFKELQEFTSSGVTDDTFVSSILRIALIVLSVTPATPELLQLLNETPELLNETPDS